MFKQKKIIITGGAGFIGGALIRRILNTTNSKIYNIDKLSYSSDLSYLKNSKFDEGRHVHLCFDLNDFEKTNDAIQKIDPDIIIHLAAESHVDRSLDNPSNFIESNILGTFNLLEASRKHWNNLDEIRKLNFRFHHISTDEVFGSLPLKGETKFNEDSTYLPSSPYSASKASSDHLVNAWHKSYGLPIIITNCSNNYGPFQFPEKLIPLSILKAINNEPIPLYGDGKNIRDWLFIEDHIDAIMLVVTKGKTGEKYCIGGNNEISNISIINQVCSYIDKFKPGRKPYSKLITFVADRPGHDRRYAISATKINLELGWYPKIKFEEGLEITVKWYLDNIEWCERLLSKSNYKSERLGI